MLLDKEWEVLLARIAVPAKPELVNYQTFEMDMIQVNPQYAIMVNFVDVENRNPKKILVEILREVFKKYKTPEEFVASLPATPQRKYVIEEDIWKCFSSIDSKMTKEDFKEIMKLLDPRRQSTNKVDMKIYFVGLSEAIVAQLLPLVNEVISDENRLLVKFLMDFKSLESHSVLR